MGEKAAIVRKLLNQAAHHRENLEAVHSELCAYNGFLLNSDEADELQQVVWNGADYEQALRRIWAYKDKPSR